MDRRRRIAKELFALAIPFGAILVWGWPFVRGDVPAWGSTTLQTLPWWTLVAGSLHSGEIAWWNPYSGFGSPLAANPQSAALSPFAVLLFAFDPGRAIGVNLFVHALIGSAGVHLAARRASVSPAFACLAALVFPLSLAVASRAVFPAFFNTVAWIGWVIATWPHRQGSGTFRVLALSGILAVAWLEGHPQAWILVLITAAVGWIPAASFVGIARGLMTILLATSLAAGLVALQALPAFELFTQSTRADGLARELAAPYDPPLWSGLLAVAPAVLGLPAAAGYRGPIGIWEWSWFAGLVPLCLALVYGLRTRDRVAFLGLAGVIGAYLPGLLEAGGATPAFAPFPVRGAGRLLVLADAALALLAARGFATFYGELNSSVASRWRRSWIAIGAGVLAGSLVGLDNGGGLLLPFAVLLLVSAALPDVVSHLKRLNRVRPRVARAAAIAALSAAAIELAMLSRTLLPRVYPAQQSPAFSSSRTRLVPDVDFVAAFQARFPFRTMLPDPTFSAVERELSNSGWIVGRRDVPAYDPLRLRREDRLASLASEDARLAGRFGLDEIGRFDFTSRAIRLESLSERVPRLALLTRWLVETDDRITESLLREDPTGALVILAAAPRLTMSANASGLENVRVLIDQPGQLVVEVNAPAPGILRVLDAFYPGWKATVDGSPVEILRADYGFRGIEVAAGAHRMEMRYEPDSIKIGASVSAVSAAIYGVMLATAFRRRWQRRAP